jgi:hypothetical protein
MGKHRRHTKNPKQLGLENIMRLKHLVVAVVLVGTLGLLAPSYAASKKKQVYYNRDRTVVISRDENGRTRTRIIIQKRSYLDPGTEPLPSERNSLDYVENPNQRADSVLNNTIFGSDITALPGPFTLPSRNNPWLQY